MEARRSVLGVCLAVLAAASCGDSTSGTDARAHASPPLAASAAALGRVAALRSRFALGAPVATGFTLGGAGAVRPELPAGARARARVELPARANGTTRVEDAASGVAIAFALRGASGAPFAAARGVALYAGALGGADVLQRVRTAGTEDYVAFDTAPDRQELVYDVDVSRVAGLRLVANTLEFVDTNGTPRLRVAPPVVVDAKGTHHAAALALDGCAVDTSPRAPWGRAVTPPGASHCALRVSWESVAYPALVDPSWVATAGTMTSKRSHHVATLLANGKVLVAGGYDGSGALKSAELYDPATSTFAATGSMASARMRAEAVTLGSGKALIIGGNDQTTGLASAELYDPAAGTFGGGGGMSTQRAGQHAATVLANGDVLVTGGYTMSGGTAGSAIANVDLYNSGTNAFTALGAMSEPRAAHSATLLANGKVLIAGGSGGGSTVYKDAVLFDPSTSGFSPTGSLTAERLGHTATLLASGKVLLAAGEDKNLALSLTADVYDPSTGTFTATGVLPAARVFASAVRLVTGKVLVVAGGPKTAAVYDPSAGTFAAGAVMSSVRVDAAASSLPSGAVLVTGGEANVDSPQDTAEVYDLKANGESCSTLDDCQSGHCADGVCCDTACAGTCDVCNATPGTCTPVAAGTSGACGVYACDGANASCPTSCTGDATCIAGDYCTPAGSCVPQKAQGAACDAHAGSDCMTADCRVCATGNCVDGVCCESACAGACQSCSGAAKGDSVDGTCGAVSDNTDPRGDCGAYTCHTGACTTSCTADTDCGSGATCNTATGTCDKPAANGSACVADAGCTSGHCVDGVCCDTACSGQCEACDGATPGKCDAVIGTPHGTRDACKGDGSACSGSCDGTTRTSCSYKPTGTSCGTATCSSGAAVTSACDGQGTCAAQPAAKCDPYACGATTCKTSCTSGSDCADGATCSTDGKCLSGGQCSGDLSQSITPTDTIDCGAFLCSPDTGACREVCNGSSDCAPGNICDTATKTCVKDSGGGDSGGCGCRAAGERRGSGAPWLVVAGLALLALRRRD